MLLRYLEGLLPPEQAQAVDEHVAECADCRWLLSVAVAGPEQELSSLPTQHLVRDEPAPREARRPPPQGHRVGEVLRDTYTITRLIGRGGMGTVYEAAHQRLHRRFAIKFLTEAYTAAKQAVARLKLEAEVTSRLAHPHIVEVTDFDYTTDGEPFIVMELLAGEPLSERLAREGALRNMVEVAAILWQTASALQAAHREGIVHRDLKPTNIFLCEQERSTLPHVKVMDFGISKVLGTNTGLTADLAVMGSPRYMAPEQALGQSAGVDQRADIFAVGVILFEMLCGEPPFSGDSIPETLYAVVYSEPALSATWAQIPAPVQQVVLRAISKKPEDRQESMDQLWQQYAAALQQAGLSAALPSGRRSARTPVPTLIGPSPASTTRLRSRWLLVGSAMLLATVGIVLALWGYMHRSGSEAVSLRPAPGADAQHAGSVQAAPELASRLAPSAMPTREPSTSRSAVSRRDRRVARTKRKRRVVSRRRSRTAERPQFGCITVQSKEYHNGMYLWANVYLDGKSVGQTALTLNSIPVGLHTVEVRRKGYRPLRRRIRVAQGACEVARFRLRRLVRHDNSGTSHVDS